MATCRSIIVILILLISTFVSLPSQGKILRGYTEEVALEELIVSFNTVQDEQGYLWFTSTGGLHRFDGEHLKYYQQDEHNGLAYKYARGLYLDNNQMLWIGTYRGLNSYDAKTQKFRHLTNDNWPKSKSLRITAITGDKNNNLWIITLNGELVHFQVSTNTFTELPLRLKAQQQNQAHELWDIKQDEKGYFWIASSAGLYKLALDINTPKLLSSQLYNTDNSGLNSNLVIKIHIGKQQNLWIATSNGVNFYHRLSNTITSASMLKNKESPLTKVNTTYFSEDQQGNLWISTWGNGAFIINKQQKQLIAQQGGFNQSQILNLRQFAYQGSASDDIFTNQIMNLFSDKQGNMWILTQGDNKKVLTSKLAIEHINFIENFNKDHTNKPKTIKEQGFSLPNIYVNDIIKDSQGYLWFATLNGLARYHKQHNTEQYFYYQKGNINSLPTNHVTSMLEDKRGNIWVGTNLGLARFNLDKGTFNRITFTSTNSNSTNLFDVDKINHNDATYYRKNGIEGIIQDKNGYLWIAFNTKLIKYDINADVHQTFKLTFPNANANTKPNSESSKINQISTIAYDGDHTIWIGKEYKGFAKFDISSEAFKHYSLKDGAPNHATRDIYIQSKERIWLATGGSLTLFENQNTFKHYQNQYSSTTVYQSIEEGKNGHLWIGTTSGLMSFNPISHQFRRYDNKYGLLGKPAYMANASFKDQDDSFYFAGHDGIDHFKPEDLTFTPPKLTPILTEFLLANRNVAIQTGEKSDKEPFTLTKAIHFIDELTLSYQHNIFSFEFNGFNYVNPEQTRYQYRLKGFDNNWIETDNDNRRATFTSIPAGDYQFEVKATTDNNPWSPIKQLKVIVLPPWWQTKLAYFIYSLGIVLLLWGLYHWRTKNIIATSRALEQQVAERTKTISQLMAQKDQMFANISHEFRTPLTLILNPAEQLLTNPKSNPQLVTKNAAGIKQNAQRLLRMVEQLLEFAKTESKTEQSGLKLYSIKQTINYLIACFDSLFTSKNLTVQVNEYQDVLLSLKPDSLEIILTNIISNAIKYSPQDANINIAIHTNAQQVTIEIKDQGIGIAPEHQNKIFERFGRVEDQQGESPAGTGIGLALVKELVLANNGQIQVISTLNQGSCFAVTLPLAPQKQIENQNVSQISANSKNITALEVSNLDNLHNATKQDALGQNQLTTSITESTAQDKPLILVIDDNQELLELITGIISPYFAVKLAKNGKQGITLATEYMPDLVISDLMMPIIDGFGVLKTLKSQPLTAHIPVIMLTAKGDEQTRIEGWNNQADEYLAKPFNSQELIARINNILNIRKIISNRFAQQFAQNNNVQAPTQTNANQEEKLDQIAEQFSHRIQQILQTHYQDENLSVETIAEQMNISHRQLVRKTKSLLSMTPNECIRTYRLQKATERLKEDIPPSTIAYEVGFASHSYFAACFKAQFGYTPSEYRKQHLNNNN